MLVKKVVIDKADRLYQLPPALSSFLPSKQRLARVKKNELLDLASFVWPISFDATETPSSNSLESADRTQMLKLSEEIANWYMAVHSVRLDPTKDIYIGAGITTLLFQIALSYVDNGDIVFVPELGLPIYRRAVTACGGQTVNYGISPRKGWQPDFERVSSRIGRVARLLFLNSPHNPTGYELSEKELADLCWITGKENIVVINDSAYASLSERKATSLLAVRGGKKIGVEVGSFAYNFGLPSAPYGYVVGNRDVIHGLKQMSLLMPFTMPHAYTELAIDAIRQFPSPTLKQIRRTMIDRSTEATQLLEMIGLERTNIDSTPFVWGKIERRRNSKTVCDQLFRRARVLTMPGNAFGDPGEGFVRISLFAPDGHLSMAHDRLKKKYRLLKLSKKS